MNTPKILVIDDQFGRSITDRRNLCQNFGIADITGDDISPAKIKKPVAEAYFSQGQSETKRTVTNDPVVSLEAIKRGWPHVDGWLWSMVLLDIRFVSGQIDKKGEPVGQDGDMDFGINILDEIKIRYPEVPVVMLSSRERHEVIEDCRRRGAADFIQWGQIFDSKTPKEILQEKLFQHGLLPDTRELKDETDRVIGNSLPILLALRSARRGATGSGNILLIAETGSGKELLARYVHDTSPKSKRPYKIFHPFRTAETLREDELFGHIRGAFTGAAADKAGLFELANSGTLFIDEIGDIPEELQLKLLRPLENRIVSRQGTDREVRLDLQVVLATNKNLDDYTKTGKFKSDLLNRINAYTITLPPLRERREDIPSIAAHLLKTLCQDHSARWPREIVPDALEALKDYDWPDNVRGLRNVLERVVKDNKDADLVVESDLRFETVVAEAIDEKPPLAVGMPEPAIAGSNVFSEYALPQILRNHSILVVEYIISALESNKDRRTDEPNYPRTWHAMTGQDVKNSATCQRNIGNYIFQLDNDDIEHFMQRSVVFQKAVLQCGKKIQSAVKRLSELEKTIGRTE